MILKMYSCVWDSLSEKVYAGRTEKFTEQELKDRIEQMWGEITVGEIRKSISSWKKRLRLVHSEDGGHIDHLVK